MKRGYALTVTSATILVVLASLYIPYPRSRLSPLPAISLRLLDRNGEVLREVLSDEGGRCRWLHFSDIPPGMIGVVLAAEDRAFFHHPGINPSSIARALIRNIKSGRIVSGASTITQQLARILCGHRRTLPAKLHEAWIALRLEKHLSKEEILSQYLNRACFGNMTYGIDAAARLYFDKPPDHLSLAETAFLAGLPRSPARLNPYRHLDSARRRQRVILDRLLRRGWVSREAWERAVLEKLSIIPETRAFRAPHFCEAILARLPSAQKYRRGILKTTLDWTLQDKVEALIRNHLGGLKEKRIQQAAAVVIDNRLGEVLCMAGSEDFFNQHLDGQVNGALALRQPGSTLKPFTYGLALERGLTAATLIEDGPIEFMTPAGRYRPRNFDRSFHGPVRMRRALACSYNVPAVALLARMGPDALYRRLRETGFQSLDRGSGFYGVGLTLGNGEVSLMELTGAFAALSRGGIYIPPKMTESDPAAPVRRPRRIFSAQISYILTDMLSDPDARVPAFGYGSPLHLPFPCASKTGTSKDFRDNWTIGYTPRFTVGVWAGNFDGRPMHNVSGVSGCGPLFRDIMLLLHRSGETPRFSPPAGLIRVAICPISGKLASASCPGVMEELFVTGTEPRSPCSLSHSPEPPPARKILVESPDIPLITCPADGDIFKMDPVLRKAFQTMKFSGRIPKNCEPGRAEWWMNGRPIGTAEQDLSFSWNLSPGSYTIRLVAFRGGRRIRSRLVTFRVLP